MRSCLGTAVLDRLVLEKYLRFEQIVEGLSLFTKRWLVVGFRAGSQADRGDGPSWYTAGNFAKTLLSRFRILELIEAGSQRVLFLCDKKPTK